MTTAEQLKLWTEELAKETETPFFLAFAVRNTYSWSYCYILDNNEFPKKWEYSTLARIDLKTLIGIANNSGQICVIARFRQKPICNQFQIQDCNDFYQVYKQT